MGNDITSSNGKSQSGASKVHGEQGKSFEESFARLQEVVARLSEGNLTLQEALGAYEEGMALAARCADMLNEAELRVKQVSERAVKAGSAALVQLDELDLNGLPGEGELLAIEIETYEAGVSTIDTAAQAKAAQQTSPGPTPRGGPQSLLEELDPLFDEE